MIAVHSVYLKGGDRLSTMKDVARVAGVSIATVSRVLAGTAAVTDSTQKKVLAAMEELQYRTAAPVRPVIRKESQLTAVCMENLTSPYYIDLLRGVEDVLFVSMDGVSGLADGLRAIFPDAVAQRCLVHLVRNSCKYVPSKDMQAFCRDARAFYGAPSLSACRVFSTVSVDKIGVMISTLSAFCVPTAFPTSEICQA